MAKVKFAPDVESISGKLCSRSGVIYAVNKQTGITHRFERHEFSDANTEAQQAVRKTFVSKGKFAAAWWKANKPSTEKPKGSEHYLLVMKAYKGQHKIGNPYSYLCSLVTEDLKVKLGDLDITGSVSVPSVGGGSSAGSGTTGGGGTDGDGDA
jgi:hypothetical protein